MYLRTPTLRSLRPRLIRSAAVLGLLGLLGLAVPQSTSAQSQTPGPDSVQLLRLSPVRPRLDRAASTLRLEAQVEYHLDTLPHAFLALLVFEDNSPNSVPGTSSSVQVERGTGQVALAVDYALRPSVRALSTFVGLFAEDKTLITYVATNPFLLGPWPGRAVFEDGMVARQAGDYAQALEDLSTAVRLSPETASYYYWRADTHLQLGQFDDAIMDYTLALGLAPADQASRIGRGISWLWKDEWQKALDDLTQAIDSGAAPAELIAWAHRARGTAYRALDRPAEAVADYQTYLAMDGGASDRAEVEGWIKVMQ
jgi:tetratricopeptide (TPR) repeat protein